MPELSPCYPLLARLWRLGFRRFEMYSLSGVQMLDLPHLPESFAGRHAGQRGFVVGNGPSLNTLDMSLLRDEVAFGSNRVYLGFEKWGFAFPYWAVTDWLQIEEYAREYEERVPEEAIAFHPFTYLPWLRFANACPFPWRERKPKEFSPSPHGFDEGHTVTYFLLQLAVMMGCNPIILIGVDHRYNLKPPPLAQRAAKGLRDAVVKPLRGTALYEAVRGGKQAWVRAKGRAQAATAPDFWESNDAADPTHFDAGYTSGARKRFQKPEPKEAEKDFARAEAWARDHGVHILNATPDSALEVFERTEFRRLF